MLHYFFSIEKDLKTKKNLNTKTLESSWSISSSNWCASIYLSHFNNRSSMFTRLLWSWKLWKRVLSVGTWCWWREDGGIDDVKTVMVMETVLVVTVMKITRCGIVIGDLVRLVDIVTAVSGVFEGGGVIDRWWCWL